MMCKSCTSSFFENFLRCRAVILSLPGDLLFRRELIILCIVCRERDWDSCIQDLS